MRIAPKDIQSFRDDFTYTNSPEAIKRFPFPFVDDEYRYSVNIEAHQPKDGKGSVYEHFLDIDEHYLSEIEERAKVLKDMPARCLTMPHMDLGCWDLIERIMMSLNEDYPEYFSLSTNGDKWVWENKLLNIKDEFTFGDSTTLPMPPLEYIGRQVQGDYAILDHRDENLFMDAGIVTCPADWSLAFNAGMSFSEWHGPVPMVHSEGIIERALKYLLTLQVGNPIRRLNWTLTVNARMDTSSETYAEWGHERASITPENVAQNIYLRVEVQVIDRLPRSNAVSINIRTYLLSLEDLVTNPVWARRMHRAMKSLPPQLVEYKGLSRFYSMVVDFLSQYDPVK